MIRRPQRTSIPVLFAPGQRAADENRGISSPCPPHRLAGLAPGLTAAGIRGLPLRTVVFRALVFRAAGFLVAGSLLAAFLLAAFLLAGFLLAGAAPAAAQSDSGPEPAEIVPHEARYDIALARAAQGSQINAVDGRFEFKWARVCDGYTLEQRLAMTLSTPRGRGLNIASTYVTWESRDGTRLRFNMTREEGGETTLSLRGEANLDRPGGTGTATLKTEDAEEQIDLPAGTVFPSWHTRILIARARAGERFWNTMFFDGASAEMPLNEVNAVIGSASTAQRTEARLPDPLDVDVGWPVSLAYFTPGSQSPAPDQELHFTLSAAGLSERIRLEYEDFAVRARLSEVTVLDPPQC